MRLKSIAEDPLSDTHVGMHRFLVDHPDDETARLVYADALQDDGYNEAAGFVRKADRITTYEHHGQKQVTSTAFSRHSRMVGLNFQSGDRNLAFTQTLLHQFALPVLRRLADEGWDGAQAAGVWKKPTPLFQARSCARILCVP